MPQLGPPITPNDESFPFHRLMICDEIGLIADQAYGQTPRRLKAWGLRIRIGDSKKQDSAI
jgi:hypothetical protein